VIVFEGHLLENLEVAAVVYALDSAASALRVGCAAG